MKMRTQRVALFIAVMMLATLAAWAQIHDSASLTGTITDDKSPVPNAQVVLTRVDIGRQYKGKTDKKGQYALLGVALGPYRVEVSSAKGEVLYVKESQVVNGGMLDIDLAHPEASGGTAGAGRSQNAVKTDVAAKSESDAVAKLNALVAQAQTALHDQKWSDAETALKQLLEMYPETTRWEFFKALGDSQGHLQKYTDAIQTYERGIQLAQAIASGSAPPDPRNPNPDPLRATLGASQMLISEGNAYVNLNQFDEGVARLKKSTEVAPNPAVAYYNLCAVYFNHSKMAEAAAACEKSTAADPKNADAWFFKGSALVKAASDDANKTARASAADAFSTYLKLEPDGTHAAEAKLNLQKLGTN